MPSVGEDPAFPGLAGGGASPVASAAEHGHADAEGAGEVAPAGPTGDLGLVVGQVEKGPWRKPRLSPISAHLVPERGLVVAMGSSWASRFCWRTQPQLRSTARRRSGPSRRRPSPAAGEVIGGRGADDAAPPMTTMSASRGDLAGFDGERRGRAWGCLRSTPERRRGAVGEDAGLPTRAASCAGSAVRRCDRLGQRGDRGEARSDRRSHPARVAEERADRNVTRRARASVAEPVSCG